MTRPQHGKVSPAQGEGVRLQVVLARAGVGSRRACEALIAAGRVEVDGERVTVQGMRVDPSTSVIRVDGLRLSVSPEQIYLALNKPVGVVSTMSDPITDPGRRPTLAQYVPDPDRRLFHVGRLDTDTEGLILLTNDGELTHRLTHPSYEVAKVYLAEIPGPVPRDLGHRLREGIDLDDGPARVDAFRVVGTSGSRVLVELTLHEGRNRIVRRMLDTAGHPVRRLVRTRIGPVTLGELRPGRTRNLHRGELGKLFRLVGM